jgi:hypothetical protein
MLSRKVIAIASLSTIVCSGVAVADDGFKSSKFLTYPVDTRSNYIIATAVSAASIAALNSQAQGKCLGDWVSRYRASGFPTVIEAMQKYPDDHPSGITLAVLQKECGSFKYIK